MSSYTIPLSAEEHQSLLAVAALQGKTLHEYAMECLFSEKIVTQLDDATGVEMRRRVAELDKGNGSYVDVDEFFDEMEEWLKALPE